MTHDPFRPFSTNMSQETALQVLQDATNGADDGELFLERRRSEALVFDDGRLKTASFDASEGFGQFANAITVLILAISIAATLLAERLQSKSQPWLKN